MSRRPAIRILDPTQKLEEIKTYLCHCVKRACLQRGWNQSQAAIYIGTSRYRIYLVDNLRTEKLTVHALIRYLASVDPEFQLLIAMSWHRNS